MVGLFVWSFTDNVQQRCLQYRAGDQGQGNTLACIVVDNFPAANDGPAALGNTDVPFIGDVTAGAEPTEAAVDANSGDDQIRVRYTEEFNKVVRAIEASGNSVGTNGLSETFYTQPEDLSITTIRDDGQSEYCLSAQAEDEDIDLIGYYDSATGNISITSEFPMPDEACSLD